MIKGITVKLYEQTPDGKDSFGHPIVKETPVCVENVLVSPASTTEILDTLNLIGKKAVYKLAVPKEDFHNWQDCRVSWRVIGLPQQGIKENIPLVWNQIWMVERYGESENRTESCGRS